MMPTMQEIDKREKQLRACVPATWMPALEPIFAAARRGVEPNLQPCCELWDDCKELCASRATVWKERAEKAEAERDAKDRQLVSCYDRMCKAEAELAALKAAQPERVSVPVSDERKFWLWKNFVGGRPEYWAFDNPYPIHLHSDDPQTLGEPCGYAIFKESRTGRTDVSEAEVLSRIKKAAAQEGK